MSNEWSGGKVKTRRWDPDRFLKSEEDMVAYLEAALEDGEPSLVARRTGGYSACSRND